MCLSHLIYTVRSCLIHTCHAMPTPRLCHALTMPFFSRPRHRMAVERRPVGYLPAFGFFRLPRGFPRRLLSDAYQSSQRSIPTTVKSGSSTLQKIPSVKLLDSWLRHCATSRKVSGSISYGVNGNFFIDIIFPAAKWTWGWLSP